MTDVCLVGSRATGLEPLCSPRWPRWVAVLPVVYAFLLVTRAFVADAVVDRFAQALQHASGPLVTARVVDADFERAR